MIGCIKQLKPKWFNTLLVAASFIVSTSTLAQNLLQNAPKGALVINQSDWHSQNTQYLANPASLMKILTATLAVDQLGEDFRFQTQLSFPTNQLQQGRLKAPLTLRLTGDPSFTRKNLHSLLLELQKQGVKKLDKVTIEASRYQGHAWGLGQVWNDHGICFAAPTGAAIINRNCVFGNLKATKAGQKSRFYITPDSPLIIDNQVLTLGADVSENCQILLKVLGANHYRLTGCLAENSKTLPLGFSGNDAKAFFAHILDQELSLLGFGSQVSIDFVSSHQEAKLDLAKTRVLSHQSAPLPELVERMLKRSDNLIADSLFKAAGYQFSQQDTQHTVALDAYQQGELALKTLLKRYDIETQGLMIRDGSGLSRENLLYAKTLYQVLTLWLSEPSYAWLVQALPVGLESGTLKNRESLKNESLKGRILAKSGSMQGVVNLAGFVQVVEKDKGSKLRPFVFIVNQFTKSKALKPAKFSQEELTLFQLEMTFLKAALLPVSSG